MGSPHVPVLHIYALFSGHQWVLDSASPEKKGDVKAKQLEALKRLGHASLQLDEYESMCRHRTFNTNVTLNLLVQKP